MVKAAEGLDTTEGKGTKEPVIDCDIHEMMSRDSLKPYLDEKWAKYKPQLPPLPYNLIQGGFREDAWPHKHGRDPGLPGSNVDLVREQVLDPFGVEVGVLTGLFHPGIADTQVEYHAALARAYNEWLAAEWLGVDDRLYGSIQVPLQDPELAADEIDRAAQNPKTIQVMLPVFSKEGYGLPKYHPIFEAAARHDLPIGMHQTSTTNTAIGYPTYYVEWHVGMNQNFMAQLSSIVFSGVLDEFPNLRIILLEGVWAWLPYLMWTMDANYKALRAEVPWLERKPSEIVREHVWFSSQPMPEPDKPEHLLQLIDMVGSDDWLVYSSDYAHWDFDAPDEAIPRSWPQELRRKVLYENAKRLYGPRLERVGA